MKKKFISALLFGAVLSASTSTFVSCSDYDDDISSLQERIDANAKAIDQINSLITSGSVITDVVNDGNGIKVMLSNGKEYLISNGADGQDAVVWNIGDDGFWYKDGVKTEYYAIGKDGKDGKDGLNGKDGVDGKDGINGTDGKDGKDGVDGKDGLNGTNGKDGGFYRPNANGTFDYVVIENDKEVVTPTSISWMAQGTLTAIMSDDNLIISGVLKDGVPTTVTISRKNILRSLVIAPEAYVDGVPAILVKSFSYNALELEKTNTKDETAGKVKNKTVVNPAVTVTYHVNPSNVNFDELKKSLSFVVKDNVEYKSTRGKASSDFDVKAESYKFDSETGELKVTVNVIGTPATKERISVVALQAKTTQDEIITSDYATVHKEDYKNLRLINSAATNDEVDYHYRRYMSAFDKESGLPTDKVWDVNGKTDAKVELVYNEEIDLDKFVSVHELQSTHREIDKDELEKLGMSVKFDLVTGYKIGSNNTEQNEYVEFVKDKDGKLTNRLRVKSQYTTSAIDRTPIVRALLKHGKEIVEVAYIKVKIVRKEQAPVDKEYVLNFKPYELFKYACEDENAVKELKTNYQTMSECIYKALEMSKDEFHSKYSEFEDVVKDEDVGTVEQLAADDNSLEQGTQVLKWTLSSADLWTYADKDVKNTVAYKSATGGIVYIRLTARVDKLTKEYDVTKAQYISNYWDGDIATFNVQLPTSTTDNNPANCVFVNDLNALFVSNASGVIDLDKNVTTVAYMFHEDMNGELPFTDKDDKDNTVKMKFTVDDSGTNLYADGQLIASINNEGNNPINYITLNKESKNAQKLLNTNDFKVKIYAKGYVCGDKDKSVSITFNGKEYFEAKYRRPVNLAEKAVDYFVDGIDLGEKHSFVKIDDLVNPYDFRIRYFRDYTNYWGYYGPFTVSADVKNATCNLNGKVAPVPASLELDTQAKDWNGNESKFGFVTYKNNGTVVNKGFEIYIDVKVNYGWGSITQKVTVPVKPSL